MLEKVTVKVEATCCLECPFCQTKRTIGAGDALDFLCKAFPKYEKVIAGYVEYDSELPQEGQIPDWCPFAEEKTKC